MIAGSRGVDPEFATECQPRGGVDLAVDAQGAAILGVCDSSHPGPAGNREYLMYLASPGHPVCQEREIDVSAEIRDAVAAGS